MEGRSKQLVTAALDRELGEHETSQEFPEFGEPQTFALTKDGLRFHFEDDVPFVIGSVHPLVRWAPLRPYLRRSVLGKLPKP
jgi:hypothetical protein